MCFCSYYSYSNLLFSIVVNTHKKSDKDQMVLQVVTEHHGKVPYPVASLHPNKDHYLQVMTSLYSAVDVGLGIILIRKQFYTSSELFLRLCN